MTNIVRTKTRATGGITADEKRRMDEIAAFWTANAFRTDPVDPERLTDAIHRLYAAADLPAPRVVIVPSPIVMAAAYGAAAAILYCRKTATDAATYAATRVATRDATRAATDAATRVATAAATDATDVATRVATDAALNACRDMAGDFGVACARNWASVYQGGNMWAGAPAYFAAVRDVLGLDLPEFAKWKAYEDCALEGGFRVMHEEFCIVSDRPQVIRIDAENRPHCEDGPSHLWRDGWALYHWHGVRVPDHWITDRANLDPAEVLRHGNVEIRAAGMEIVGWAKALDVLNAEVIDSDPNPDHGDLIEMRLPGLSEPGLFLRAYCPRNGLIVEGVPRVSDIDGKPINTVKAAQAWSFGMAEAEFTYPTAVS